MLPGQDYRVRQRDFLLEITRAITSQLDLNEVLKRVLHASLVMLRGDTGLIALRAQDDRFYVRAVSGMDTNKVEMLNKHLATLTEMLHNGVDSETFNSYLREMAHDLDEDLEQAIALPMKFAEEALGLVIVFRSQVNTPTHHDMQMLQSFADQAAIAVHNAQLYEQISRERQHLAAILEHSADGVMILNPDLTIVRFNRALERMTGWHASDAVGRHQDEVFQWAHLEDSDLQDAIAEGWPYTLAASNHDDTPLYVEGDLLRTDEMAISIGISYSPMFTTDGKLNGIIANVRDISNIRRAQEMQNTFISVISHELKTPVSVIKGYAATLSRPDAQWTEEIVRDTMQVVEEEADRLHDLIQNLLTASRIQAQREIKLDLSDLRLDHLAERAIERVSPQSSIHTFEMNFPADYPVVQGDETRLRQVIDNLLSNAIKYSPQGGTIEIGGSYTDKSTSLYVRDQGVGLSPEDQERVFDRFFRVDGKLSRKTQGTGLGLYLAKAIIEAHNGTIGVESQPGHGSTFYFTIPIDSSTET